MGPSPMLVLLFMNSPLTSLLIDGRVADSIVFCDCFSSFDLTFLTKLATLELFFSDVRKK